MEITPTGSTIVITKGGLVKSFQKKRISFEYANGAIKIRYGGRDAYYITDNDDVTNLPSDSMLDLYIQLQQLKNA